jgi:hypothetical protein
VRYNDLRRRLVVRQAIRDSEFRLQPHADSIGSRELDPCASGGALFVAVDCDVLRYCAAAAVTSIVFGMTPALSM